MQGALFSIWAAMLSRCVSARTMDVARDDAQPLGAQLDLRGGFLAGNVEDRAGRRQISALQSWMSRVDLPTPGSPLMRTTEPGTMPPPNTRLISLIGTGIRS